MPRKTWLRRQRRFSERLAGKPMRLVVSLRRPGLAQGSDIRPPPIDRSVPVAAVSIMSTNLVFIGPTLISIRTLRLSMRNLPWGFDTTMRLGDGISKNVTWIPLWRRMIAVQACRESGPVWKSLLDCRAKLWAASGQFRAPRSLPSGESSVRVDTALYISAHQRDRRIGSQIPTLAVKSFTRSVVRK
jgi:hypothetical protein